MCRRFVDHSTNNLTFKPRGTFPGKVESNFSSPTHLLPLCETPSKLSNDVLSFTWLVLDYLPVSPSRPIKHLRSHGPCLTGSAFIMVINSGTKSDGGTIQFREIWKCLLPKGPHIDSSNFTSHSPKVFLLNMREGNCSVGSFTFHVPTEELWCLSGLWNPAHVSHIALGGSIVGDNMFLKAFLFTWPGYSIPHSPPVL